MRHTVFHAIVLTGAVLTLASCASPVGGESDAPRNVILFIADGMGPAHVTMARGYRLQESGKTLEFDALHTGAVVTRSSHGRVTDSAASATAYACGIRTRNGRIAVDTTGRPVGTVLEAAERAGYWTGLVSTARITHATPAAFSAHVEDRARENEIAAQQIEQGIEVVLGGGLRHFLPEGEGGVRTDGRNLVAELEDRGATIALDRDDLGAVSTVPVVGLFDPEHVDYQIDLDEGNEPSLAEMTRAALTLLSDAPDGFFVMIEAGRVDHAAHGSDAAAALHDVLAYDEAMKVALDFARADGSTLIVATSDHETGGLSLGRNGVYSWSPEALRPVSRSLEILGEDLLQRAAGASSAAEVVAIVMEEATEAGMGPFDDAALERVSSVVDEAFRMGASLSVTGIRIRRVLADIVSRRAGVGWTTEGHTAVDVPMYAFGPGSESFSGTIRNDDFGLRLARVLGVDPTSVPLDPAIGR